MWCIVGYFYIYAIRNALTTTAAAVAPAAPSSSSSSSINSSSVSLSTRFSRATYTPSPSVSTVYNRPRHSIFCSFFHFLRYHLRRSFSFSFTSTSCLLFLSSPMTPRILLAPSPSMSTLQTSFRLISFTYSSPLPTVRLTVFPCLRPATRLPRYLHYAALSLLSELT